MSTQNICQEEEYESCQHQLPSSQSQGQVTHYWSNCIRDTQDLIAQTANVIASAKSLLRSLQGESKRCQLSNAQAMLLSPTLFKLNEMDATIEMRDLQSVQEVDPSLCHTFSFDVRSTMLINTTILSPSLLSPPTSPLCNHEDQEVEFDPSAIFSSSVDWNLLMANQTRFEHHNH